MNIWPFSLSIGLSASLGEQSSLLRIATLWVAAGSHCRLEVLPGFEFLSCCQHPESEKTPAHHEKECGDDGCAAVELGFYKLAKPQQAPMKPLLAVGRLAGSFAGQLPGEQPGAPWSVLHPLRRSFPGSGNSPSARPCRRAHHRSFPEPSPRGLLCQRGVISRRVSVSICVGLNLSCLFMKRKIYRNWPLLLAVALRQCECAAGNEPGICIRLRHQRP